MLNQRLAVTRTVTHKLAALEKQIDEAAATASELYAAAIAGRRSAHLALDAGEDAIDLVVRAMAKLTSARKAVHAAHYGFRDVRNAMGVPPVAYGDTGDTPDSFSPKGAASVEARPLSVVKAA